MEIELAEKKIEQAAAYNDANEIKVHRMILEEAEEADKANGYFFDYGKSEIHEQLKIQLISGKD